MGLFGAIGAIAAPILGGVVGGIASKGDKKRANRDRDAALGQYNIGAPTLGPATRERLGDPGNVTYNRARAGQAAYGPMVHAGSTGYDRVKARQTGYDRIGYKSVKGRDIRADQVDAPMLNEREMLQSEFGRMYEDPRMRQTQLSLLDRYEQMSREGLTPEDRAALYGIQKQQEAAVRSQRQGIQGQMMRAGTFGSGMQLAMQLQGAQDQNELAMMQAMETGAQSHAARREGLAGAAGMASDIRNTDFAMQSDRAHALDDMARYNEDSAQRYEMANQDFEMRAALANQDSSLRARLANQSTDMQGQMANQGAHLQAGMANQSTRLSSDQGNANRSLQAGMANQSTRLSSDQGNRDARLRASMSNQGMISGTNQFNAGQRTSASIHNSGMSLQSSMQNIENRMKTSMFNSEGNWQEQMAAREAQQWQWAQQLGLADRRSGIHMDRANMYDQRAQDTRNAWAGMGAGAGSMIGGLFGKGGPAASGGGGPRFDSRYPLNYSNPFMHQIK